MEIKYGTSGNPPNFFSSPFGKDRQNAADWISSIGLNAYERMMTYGARMKEEDAVRFGKRAKKLGVALSIHAPYYIVLTSTSQKVLNNFIKEMIKTTHLASLMGCKKVIFHPGFGDDVKKVIKNLKKLFPNSFSIAFAVSNASCPPLSSIAKTAIILSNG